MINKKKLGLFLFCLLLSGIIYLLLKPYITLTVLKAHAERAKELSFSYPFLSLILFIISYFFFAFTPIPGEAFFSLLGGFIFGKIKGGCFALIGATSGATCAFLFARHFLGSYLKEHYSNHHIKMSRYFEEQGPFFVLGLRLIPTLPSSFINYLAGLTPIKLWQFTLSTFVGVMPVTLLLVFAGQKLYDINSISEILTPSWIAILLGLTLLSFLSPIMKALKNKGFLQR